MSQAMRPPAEEGALVPSLREEAERLGVRLVVCPWRDVADLRLVSLETCFARRRRRGWRLPPRGRISRAH
jgi:hypothetical protein